METKMPKEFNVFKSEVFYHAIDKALENSCANGYKREPCYTAALTKELPKILNDIMNEEAKRSGMPPKYRFGSCYVHQKPYVKFDTGFTSCCELGDLLVLVKRTIDGTAAFNSALFQLKKTSNKSQYCVPQKGGDNKQLTLYTKWGELKIDLKSKPQSTERYDITPHAVSQGGSYMFIRLDKPSPKFVVAVPDRKMRISPPSLGVYLYNMTGWRSGRTIAPQGDVCNGCADDWSRLIWSVIGLLQNETSCSCKGYGNVTRDNGCGLLSFLTDYSEIYSIGESENRDSETDDGFGVFYIDVLDVPDDKTRNSRNGKE